MLELKNMSINELKEYLSSHRDNDEAFSEALAELMSRNHGAVRYSPDLSLTEIGRIIREKLARTD